MNDNFQLKSQLKESQKEVRRLEQELQTALRRNETLKLSFHSQLSLNKAMEQEKIRQEIYVDLLLSYCPDIIIMLDNDLRFLLGTTSVAKLVGVKSTSQLYKMTLATILEKYNPKLFTLGFLREISLARREKERARPSFEVEVDDSIYEVDVLPFDALSGEFAGILIIMHDITALANAKNMAVEANKAKSEFLSRMSHEMCTPMNAVVGMTNIALQNPETERKDYCLLKIKDASSHMLQIVNDILDISKIEANKLELDNQPFNMRTVIEKTVGVLNVQVEEKNQNFTVNLNPNLPSVIISDELRLTQLITNLLSNAIKFTPNEGNISLSIDCIGNLGDDTSLRVMVSDSGIGISAEKQKRVFSAFEQADGGTARKYGGSGLGLAICKRIVDVMGGIIWVESEPDKGSSFIFIIPFTMPEDSGEDVHEPKQEGIPNLSGHKILIAEDIDINREIIEVVLDETGVEIVFAENGLDAVSFLQKDIDGFSAILMDIQMPLMDGYEATRTIRGMPSDKAKEIPIIAMTANVFREDVERCMEAGANAHLGKPLDAAELYKVLSQLLFNCSL